MLSHRYICGSTIESKTIINQSASKNQSANKGRLKQIKANLAPPTGPWQYNMMMMMMNRQDEMLMIIKTRVGDS